MASDSKASERVGDGISVLRFPTEIRYLIYEFVFMEAVVRVLVKTRQEFETGNGNLWKLDFGPEYNIILSCKQCYREARTLFYNMAELRFSNKFTTREITKICSRSMSEHVKILSGIRGLCFEDFDRLEKVYPDLEQLHVILPPIVMDEQHYFDIHINRQMDFDQFVGRYIVQNRSQSDLIEFLGKKARFQTLMSFERVSRIWDPGNSMPAFLDVSKLDMDLRKENITIN